MVTIRWNIRHQRIVDALTIKRVINYAIDHPEVDTKQLTDMAYRDNIIGFGKFYGERGHVSSMLITAHDTASYFHLRDDAVLAGVLEYPFADTAQFEFKDNIYVRNITETDRMLIRLMT